MPPPAEWRRAQVSAPRLTDVFVGDTAEAWRAAGFETHAVWPWLVEGGPPPAARGTAGPPASVCDVGGVRFHLLGGEERGVLGYTFETDAAPPGGKWVEVNRSRVQLVPPGARAATPRPQHPNGVSGVVKAVVVCKDLEDSMRKMAAEGVLQRPLVKGAAGFGFALWAVKGMEMFEAVHMPKAPGAAAGVDTVGALFVEAPDLGAAVTAAGGARHFAEGYAPGQPLRHTSGRDTMRLKGKKVGISAPLIFQGPVVAKL